MVIPGDTAAQEISPAAPRFIRRANPAVGLNRLKDGLTIGPLRATGGPPGVSDPQEPVARQESPGLFDLPRSGESVLSSLAAQVRPADPLTPGLAGGEPTSLDLLQARQLNLRHQFQRFDNQSRFLQVSGNPRREKGGFGLRFSDSTLDLLG